MEIEKYRTIEATLDLTNDYVPPIRLNAGDMNGRILKFNVTDGGEDVDDLNGLSARLTWNRDPSDPSSGGGWRNMSAQTNTDNASRMRQVTFTTPVPQALLQQAGERTVLGLDIEDADGNTIASRNIPIFIEPSRLNPRASEIADPLKDLHDPLDQAQTLVNTATLTRGTVTTLVPSKKATGSMTGTGWQRKLNLSIPRGSKISQLGPKGDPGDASNVPIATDTVAGIVKSGYDIRVLSDGTLSLRDSRWYSQIGISDSPFNIATVFTYRGMGIYYDPLVTFTPNMYYNSNSVTGPIEVQVLSDDYQFTNDTPKMTRHAIPMLASTTDFANGMTWVEVRITPIKLSTNVTIEFYRDATTQTTYNLCINDSVNQELRSPSFTCLLDDVREVR